MSVHTAFAAECSTYFVWQTLGLVYSFERSGQPGPLTRLISCTGVRRVTTDVARCYAMARCHCDCAAPIPSLIVILANSAHGAQLAGGRGTLMVCLFKRQFT